MTRFVIKWNDIRTVWSEVEAKSEKEAIKKILAGKGVEVDWCGSDTPQSEKDIEDIEKKEGPV